MAFGFFRKESRHVVATVLVGVDGEAFLPLQRATLAQAEAIVAAPDDFGVASAAVATVARALLDHESCWTHAAIGGEVFDDEASAGAQLGEVFADLAGRYLSVESERLPRAAGDDTSRERRCVVMLTVAYAGQNDEIERELSDRSDVAAVLRAISALHARDALLGAHVHAAPAHPDDRLTDEQLLACFPELTTV